MAFGEKINCGLTPADGSGCSAKGIDWQLDRIVTGRYVTDAGRAGTLPTAVIS